MTELGPIPALGAAEPLCPSAVDPLMGPDAEPMQQPGPVPTSIIGERARSFWGGCVAVTVGVFAHLPMLAMARSRRETRGCNFRELEVGA